MTEETKEATQEELSPQETIIQEMQTDAVESEEKTNEEEISENKTDEQTESESETEKEPVIDVSEEEVDELLTEKKTAVQKRIDKLVAERNSAKDDLESLRKEVEELKKSKETKSDGRPKYSLEQLEKAELEVERMLDEEDVKGAIKLEREIAKQRIAWERYNAVNEINAPQREQTALQEKIKAEWNQYVAEYEYNDDKDLCLTNQNSLIYKVINKLSSENAKKYSRYKEFAWNQIATDAKDLILQARYKKASSKENRKLEKELVDEKLKTQLGSGVSSGSATQDSKKKTYKTPLDEVFAERQSIQDDTKGLRK